MVRTGRSRMMLGEGRQEKRIGQSGRAYCAVFLDFPPSVRFTCIWITLLISSRQHLYRFSGTPKHGTSDARLPEFDVPFSHFEPCLDNARAVYKALRVQYAQIDSSLSNDTILGRSALHNDSDTGRNRIGNRCYVPGMYRDLRNSWFTCSEFRLLWFMTLCSPLHWLLVFGTIDLDSRVLYISLLKHQMSNRWYTHKVTLNRQSYVYRPSQNPCSLFDKAKQSIKLLCLNLEDILGVFCRA